MFNYAKLYYFVNRSLNFHSPKEYVPIIEFESTMLWVGLIYFLLMEFGKCDLQTPWLL